MDFDEGCMDLDICVQLVAILGSIFSADVKVKDYVPSKNQTRLLQTSLCALEMCSAVCRSLIVAGQLGQ
ncbi:hypothetical protein PRUPE_5G229400 [Prunus persica]|uniref:Uncharacterized protein n=1 Tax=Prunus persica TaxID=3760 RepID=A0A251PCI0_PRUPE|nr:hypothetical protein PRUPE_5G229400 [Prunus persica]